MDSIEKCFRASATACDKRADEARDPEAKQLLCEAAEGWQKMADHEDEAALQQSRLS
jgi:hypothetical protein